MWIGTVGWHKNSKKGVTRALFTYDRDLAHARWDHLPKMRVSLSACPEHQLTWTLAFYHIHRLPPHHVTPSEYPQGQSITPAKSGGSIGIGVRPYIPRHFATLTRKAHTSMGHETNIDPIRVLEKQIEEGKGDIIKLKRT